MGSGGALECCMCGDPGLSRELFRCMSCRFRFQHRYCSDLYPKAEHYKACNWCLREEGKKPAVSPGKDHAALEIKSSPPISPSTARDNNNSNGNSNSNSNCNGSSSTSNRNNSSGGRAVPPKAQRGGFHLQPDKPVKKQRRPLQRSASEVLVRSKSGGGDVSPGGSASGGSGRGRHGFRGRIRRYKLLEEVSS